MTLNAQGIDCDGIIKEINENDNYIQNKIPITPSYYAYLLLKSSYPNGFLLYKKGNFSFYKKYKGFVYQENINFPKLNA